MSPLPHGWRDPRFPRRTYRPTVRTFQRGWFVLGLPEAPRQYEPFFLRLWARMPDHRFEETPVLFPSLRSKVR